MTIVTKELQAGSIFFATTHRITAKWHCTGKIVGEGKVRIDRIWRDDRVCDWPLAWSWKESESGGRIVTDITLGHPNLEPGIRNPAKGSICYDVINPKNIFRYDEDFFQYDEEYEDK